MARKLIEDSISKFFLAFDAVEKEELSYAELPHQQNNFSGEHGLEAIQLKIDQDGSPVTLEPGIWFVLFIPGLQKQWWHRFVNKRHMHVFAMRPESKGQWTLFEPLRHRLLTYHFLGIGAQVLPWGARDDVLPCPAAFLGRPGHQNRRHPLWISGWFVALIGWRYALLVWVYALIWFVINDSVKI